MNMSKSRGIQAKMPSPKMIYASNELKSVLARNLEECRDNDKNSQSVFLSFKCILARNCEGTEQLQYILSLTLTRCSRKNQNWSTGPIIDMHCNGKLKDTDSLPKSVSFNFPLHSKIYFS